MSKTADKAIELEGRFSKVRAAIFEYGDKYVRRFAQDSEREKYCLETIRDNIKDLEFYATESGVSVVPF